MFVSNIHHIYRFLSVLPNVSNIEVPKAKGELKEKIKNFGPS